MKKLWLLAMFVPGMVMGAQPINTLNNPNQPGYVNPSQGRMQQQMMIQQQQQKGMLNQQLQTQNIQQQQSLQTQINTNSQRVISSQPGNSAPYTNEQVLPNTNGGMLQQNVTSPRMLDQNATSPTGGMLNQNRPAPNTVVLDTNPPTGGMLNSSASGQDKFLQSPASATPTNNTLNQQLNTPQPNIPLKTIGP